MMMMMMMMSNLLGVGDEGLTRFTTANTNNIAGNKMTTLNILPSLLSIIINTIIIIIIHHGKQARGRTQYASIEDSPCCECVALLGKTP